MAEEEKKAIEFLNNYIKDDKEDIKILNSTIDEDIDYYNEVAPIERRLKYLETIKNLIEKLQKENEELRKNQKYKKDFNGEQIFCLEYDKETLRDMVLEKQEEIKELKSNSIPKNKIRKLEDMWNDNIWNATDEASKEKAEMIRDVYRGLLDE